MTNVLYIHGMGGGGDSRIPSILNGALAGKGVNVVVRTYSFDPEVAGGQIAGWVEELKPQLIVGESLGAVHAMRIKGFPHILISPALNAPLYFSFMAWLTFIPGVSRLLNHIYRSDPGDRQTMDFTYDVLRKYGPHRAEAMKNTPLNGGTDYYHAFIGTKDHYRKSGIVSFRTWKKYFGETYSVYEGTHFTEEEYVLGMVVPKILEILGMA